MAYFLLSILLLLTGHVFKMFRWKYFISVYEKINTNILLYSLSVGYIVSFIVPTKIIGDIISSIVVGKKVKNKVPFALATIAIGRLLDFCVIFLLFLLLYLITPLNKDILKYNIIFYIGVLGCLTFFSILLYFNSSFFKKIIQKIASIFNSRIEFNLLLFFWSFVSVYQNISTYLSIFKVVIYTLIMWFFYFLSYFIFSIAVTNLLSFHFDLQKILIYFFSIDSFIRPTLFVLIKENFFYLSILWIIYIFSPLFIIFIFSYFSLFFKKNNIEENKFMENLLPYQNEQEKLSFLELYFSGDKQEYIDMYLNINRDILIIKDYSAGSNATTLLCTKNNIVFFRKYNFGSDAKKLYEQIQWIELHQNKIPLPQIINSTYTDKYCSYDMSTLSINSSFFEYIHLVPVEKSWQILESVFKMLKKELYSHEYNSNLESINNYIENKILNNYNKIKENKLIRELYSYSTLIINGIEYKNLPLLEQYFQKEYLYKIFKNDKYSEIHGDLTVENLVIYKNELGEDKFYFIDPNTGNIHNSPNLDFGKMLQSLHGGYEFLRDIQKIEVINNSISYQNFVSNSYQLLYLKYNNYLFQNFEYDIVKSIYFHEIVHWLRLLPYKFYKNPKQAVIYYVEFIKICNYIFTIFENRET